MRDDVAYAGDASRHHLRRDEAHPRDAEAEPHARNNRRGRRGKQDFRKNVALRRAEDARRIYERGAHARNAVDGVQKYREECPDENNYEHREFDIVEKDPIEIYVEGSSIILKKFEPNCIFCGSTKDLSSFNDKLICKDCAKKIGNLSSNKDK